MFEAKANIVGDLTPELSIVMPCLNEAQTVGICVQKALAYLEMYNVQGEVIVADNGSSDGSQAIAAGLGARVVPVSSRGYGNTLRAGINQRVESVVGNAVVGLAIQCELRTADAVGIAAGDRAEMAGERLVLRSRFL
jgi:glycosyltransferase involved in cell wall biosynthesis